MRGGSAILRPQQHPSSQPLEPGRRGEEEREEEEVRREEREEEEVRRRREEEKEGRGRGRRGKRRKKTEWREKRFHKKHTVFDLQWIQSYSTNLILPTLV